MSVPVPPAGPPVILLLQGPRSPFFAHLAGALEAGGARVERVLFCPGDALFWGGRPAVRFRDRPEAWPAAVRMLMQTRGVTDVLGLGDGRWWHAEAFAVARTMGVRVHVLEQGHLRPGWLTLEPGAFGAWRPGGGVAPPLPEPPRWRASFAAFAGMDVAHHAANMTFGWRLYPHHRTHELHGPLAEWAGWTAKALLWPARRWGRARARAAMAAAPGPVFLLALQLETDFQLRQHGPAGGLGAALDAVAASFARHAPEGARLVVKPHPLDHAPWRWQRRLRASEAAARALWLDGGDLAALWPKLAGVVTVNSTVGLTALRAGVPVAVLGRSIYAPLAHAGGLDSFWKGAQPPAAATVAGFCARLAHDIQVPGAFDGEGMLPGARAVAARLLAAASGIRAP